MKFHNLVIRVNAKSIFNKTLLYLFQAMSYFTSSINHHVYIHLINVLYAFVIYCFFNQILFFVVFCTKWRRGTRPDIALYHYAQFVVDLPVDRISRALARYCAQSR